MGPQNAVAVQDTSWLDTYLSHIPHIVYQVDEAEFTIGAQHATKANKGNEASAYLQVCSLVSLHDNATLRQSIPADTEADVLHPSKSHAP